MFINSNNFNFDNIANLANFFNFADEFVFKFADMAKAITAGKDFNKGAEIFDGRDLAFIDFADFDFFSDSFNFSLSSFSALGVAMGDENSTVILDINFSASGFLNAFDVFATGSDEGPDLFRINFHSKKSRSKGTDSGPWLP